jgi:hypothetical protein
MSQGAQTTAPEQAKPGTNYVAFAIKTIILAIVVSLAIVYMAESIMSMVVEAVDLQPVKTRLRKVTDDERVKIRLKGFLTTNPAVHYRVSQIEEQRGNLANAIDEIELAVGLLELHSSDRSAKDRYMARLKELKRKLEAQALATGQR